MEFTIMRNNLIKHFNKMVEDVTMLFEVDLDKDELWNLYLDKAASAGGNEMFRERRELDCSACRHFVKQIGNVVKINKSDNSIETIWGFDTEVEKYQSAIDALDRFVKEKAVKDIYVARESRVGCSENYETVENGKQYTWTHFYVDVPTRLINHDTRSSVGEIQGRYRDVRNVFKRSLDEITQDSLETVLELIATNSLYKGKEWEDVLKRFLEYKKSYENTPENQRESFAWIKSIEAGPVIGKIRNHSMGTLLVNISEGMNLELAVKKYEDIVAPTNYKRSNAVFTKKMLEDAKKTLTEEGYMDSLRRRFAKVDDITVNNILFCNRDTAKQMNAELDIFGALEKDAKSNPKKFDRVEEIAIDKFISDVLPTAQDVELYLENKHAGNFVSLIAPEIPDSKNMFKWNNNFSWAYAGNVTDSMKELVKAAGGKVDGDLRFSIKWNDGTEYDGTDVDAHCVEPDRFEIYYSNRFDRSSGGNLDVDIIDPQRNTPAVENITWPSRTRMKPGVYKFGVVCFGLHGGKSGGFRAEIEFDGQIYSFDYSKPLRSKQRIEVAEVTLDKNGNFTIKELLPSATSSRTIWNLSTNQFVPVSAIMYSPNFWEGENGIGHQHVFFMLKDCINPENPNGWYNEFLCEDLYQKHRKVMDALGTKMAVAECDNQLSGVGFSMTKRGEVVVKVKGATERVLKVKF